MTYTHGTNYGYLRRRCRCDECRAWWSAYMRDYRQRRMVREGETMRNGRFIKPGPDKDEAPG
jgi:hypothetical protein